jgi:hypothetical protein
MIRSQHRYMRHITASSDPEWTAVAHWYLMCQQDRRRPQRLAVARERYLQATQVPATPPAPRVGQLRALVGRFLGTLLFLSVIIVPALTVMSCAAILGAGQ